MAITLYSTPSSVSSVKSPIVFDVVTNSTDITTAIKGELYFRRNLDEFFELVGEKLQLTKYPNYNYYRFNFAGLLEKLLTSNYQTGATGLYSACENSSIQYYVKFTEYYPIPTPVAQASTYSSVLYANNTNILVTETQGTFTGSDWYMDAAGSHKFLTNSPASQPIRASERIQLGLLTSYTDATIKLRETKNNGATAITNHEISNSTNYYHYLWDYTVDEDEAVVAVTPATPLSDSPYISALSATSFMKYMPDSINVMWGGVRMVATNDVLDILLPVVTAGSTFGTKIHAIAKTSSSNFEVYYYYSGAWNLSAGSPYTQATTFADTSEPVPANSTSMRIKKLTGGELWIPYVYINWVDDNIVMKRAQFTLDTTHIDSDTNKLEIWADDGSSNIISEVKTFVVDTSPVDATSRFAFLNLRGDFDHYTFKQGHSEDLSVEKIKYITELPTSFTTSDRQTSVAFVNSDIVFTSWTEYEENATLTWLKELVESKEVYLIVSDVKYAVDIITSGVAYSNHTEPLQFEITWRFASKRNA